MAAPDTRPTVDFGRRNGRNSAEAKKAAAQLRAGEKRAAAQERADAYRKAMDKGRAPQGYGARTRRRRANPRTTNVGPAADQFRDVEY